VPDWSHEIAAGTRQGRIVCGVDEVGRGPLAGPVLACAVVLPAELDRDLAARLDDSKKIPAGKRADISAILRGCVRYGIGAATVAEIDEVNILQATFLAMRRAVAQLAMDIDHALVDGNRDPKLGCPATLIVEGDRKSLSIAAASIIAKVERDKIMRELGERHTGYGWERNAGYGTEAHLEAIRRLGITPEHRRSFRPICESLALTY
jgi:ribonuclease HII